MSNNTKQGCHRCMPGIMWPSCIFWRYDTRRILHKTSKQPQNDCWIHRVQNRPSSIIIITHNKHLQEIYDRLKAVIVMVLKCTCLYLTELKNIWFRLANVNELHTNLKWLAGSSEHPLTQMENNYKTQNSSGVFILIWNHVGKILEKDLFSTFMNIHLIEQSLVKE